MVRGRRRRICGGGLRTEGYSRVSAALELSFAEFDQQRDAQAIACICKIQQIDCYLNLQPLTCIVLEYGPEIRGGLSDQDP
jgi:hypothetical protein